MDIAAYEVLFEQHISQVCLAHPDPSHDILHVKRVVTNAKRLALQENAKLEIVVPAAYLHDLVLVAKSDPLRSQASRLSALAARQLLAEWGYPEECWDSICHAIEAHSFSSGLRPQTLEAKVVQDADRLDALGAIGIARCMITAGLLQRTLYAGEDTFCEAREADDSKYTLDHFYTKLLKLAAQMQTPSARVEAQRRTQTMLAYLDSLKAELSAHTAH